MIKKTQWRSNEDWTLNRHCCNSTLSFILTAYTNIWGITETSCICCRVKYSRGSTACGKIFCSGLTQISVPQTKMTIKCLGSILMSELMKFMKLYCALPKMMFWFFFVSTERPHFFVYKEKLATLTTICNEEAGRLISLISISCSSSRPKP